MVRRFVLASLFVAGTALANGRPPQTSTINFRVGNEQHVAAGMTFGLVISHDGGATWHWMCEKAIQYGGNYDPDYAYSNTGALFATTFDGSLVNRTGCAFDLTSNGVKFMSSITLGPDNALYMAASHVPNPTTGDPGDSRIFKSTDNGMTFPTSAMPGQIYDWWSTIEVAPSDAQRVYLTGFRLMPTRQLLMFRSNDGGSSFQPMSMTGMTTTKDSTIEIVGIGNTDPDLVFARVSYQVEGAVSDGIYRSVNGGQTWQLIQTKTDLLSFLVRNNGDLVVGTLNSGMFVSLSPSNGAAWSEVPNAPKVNCLAENSANEVWACTPNFGVEDAGILKSSNLTTWSKVLRYQEIQGPVECAPGTLQRDQCVESQDGRGSQWCILRAQFDIASNPTNCVVEDLDGVGDAVIVKPPEGCCQTGGSVPVPPALGLGAWVWMLRRRRRAA